MLGARAAGCRLGARGRPLRLPAGPPGPAPGRPVPFQTFNRQVAAGAAAGSAETGRRSGRGGGGGRARPGGEARERFGHPGGRDRGRPFDADGRRPDRRRDRRRGFEADGGDDDRGGGGGRAFFDVRGGGARPHHRGDRGDRYRSDRGDRYRGDRGDRGDRYRSDRGDRGGERWGDRDDRYRGDRQRGGERWGGREPRRDPERPKIADEILGEPLYGVSPVITALAAGRRELHALYLQEAAGGGPRDDDRRQRKKERNAAALRRAEEVAAERGVPVRRVSKHDLNLVSNNWPHQGLVLDASPLGFTPLKAMPDVADGLGALTANRSVWLALDEVMDPQNFGAILRSAHFLGVDGVVTCGRNSAPLSPAVSKASAGAMELADVYSCKSFPSFLKDAAATGWEVLGASLADEAVDCAALRLEGPTLVVIGNEGAGLRALVRQACTKLVKIQGGAAPLGGLQAVDSLNVSVAAGVVLHHLTSQREA